MQSQMPSVNDCAIDDDDLKINNEGEIFDGTLP